MRERLRRLAGRPAAEPLRAPLPTGLLDVLRDGPAVLVPRPGAVPTRLQVAVVVPPFRRGSGGHGTIANLVRGLEARGHAVAVHVLDDEGRHAGATEAQVGADFRAWFGPVRGPVRLGLGAFAGADVVVATGWQTVPAVLRLEGAGARAYLVQDHEPEFFATSAEREWATWTYGQGLHHIAASAWLDELLRARYASAGGAFDLGVDHVRYAPPADAGHRRTDLVVFYARAVTPRRAVPLGLLALQELHRRRPDVEIALFGESRPLEAPFPATQLGILDGAGLAALYGEATAGLVLSMTNPSLVPLEMLACGLPVVDLASDSMVRELGRDGPAALAAFDPLAVAATLERLLGGAQERERRTAAGLAFIAPRTWASAAEQVEAQLRAALAAQA